MLTVRCISRNHNQKAMLSVIAHLPDISCTTKTDKEITQTSITYGLADYRQGKS